jgi:hypothetical protein
VDAKCSREIDAVGNVGGETGSEVRRSRGLVAPCDNVIQGRTVIKPEARASFDQCQFKTDGSFCNLISRSRLSSAPRTSPHLISQLLSFVENKYLINMFRPSETFASPAITASSVVYQKK